MADGYDEFGWPLSALGRLRQLRGIRETQGELGYEPASPRQPLETGEPGPFSIAEYSLAVAENMIFDQCKAREAQRNGQVPQR